MAWNEPGKDEEKDQDPWKNNDKKKDQGPPDLDVVFQKLADLFGKKRSGGNGNGNSVLCRQQVSC